MNRLAVMRPIFYWICECGHRNNVESYLEGEIVSCVCGRQSIAVSPEDPS